MFFDVFKSLCEKKGVSCKRATEEMGFSNSISTKWKKTGATPQGETLNKIAEYFNVSTDYLLGLTLNPYPAGGKGEKEITFSDFTYAMENESKGLTEEDKEMLLSLARRMRTDKSRDGEKALPFPSREESKGQVAARGGGVKAMTERQAKDADKIIEAVRKTGDQKNRK